MSDRKLRDRRRRNGRPARGCHPAAVRAPPLRDASETGSHHRAHRFLLDRFRIHLRLYLLLCGGLTLANLFTGAGWWSFAPVCGWGIVLAVHYFYVRAVNVDDDWVRERTDDLRVRSYDLGHITDLEERVEQGDESVRPAAERGGRKGGNETS